MTTLLISVIDCEEMDVEQMCYIQPIVDTTFLNGRRDIWLGVKSERGYEFIRASEPCSSSSWVL